jgi:phosphocarrier protein
MIKKEITITNELGLHARPANRIVTTAAPFQAELWIHKDGLRINGKSIMGVLMLQAEKGSVITLEVDGSDEKQLLQALEDLFAQGFAEEDREY